MKSVGEGGYVYLTRVMLLVYQPGCGPSFCAAAPQPCLGVRVVMLAQQGRAGLHAYLRVMAGAWGFHVILPSIVLFYMFDFCCLCWF